MLFNFSEHREIPRNSRLIPDVFLEKAPVTASSKRPRRCYGAFVTFYRVPMKFLLAILCALMARTLCALRFHSVCTALSRRLHCADCMTSKNVCKYQELQIQPIQPKGVFPKITTCVILKIVKILENILSTE